MIVWIKHALLLILEKNLSIVSKLHEKKNHFDHLCIKFIIPENHKIDTKIIVIGPLVAVL